MELLLSFLVIVRKMWNLKKVKNSLLVFLFLLPIVNDAQVIDSIKYFMSEYKPVFFAQLNNRGSFVSNMIAPVTSVVAGVTYDKRVKIGGSIGKVTSKVYKDVYVNNNDMPQKALLRLWFAGGYFEYTYYKQKHLEISIPIHLDIGVSDFSYTQQGETFTTNNKLGLLYEAYTVAIYKPVFFVGIGGGVGYRLSLFDGDTFLTRSFTSVIYDFELKIYFGTLVRKIRM